MIRTGGNGASTPIQRDHLIVANCVTQGAIITVPTRIQLLFQTYFGKGIDPLLNSRQVWRFADTMQAIVLLLRMHWLFRVEGKHAVATATARALRCTPSTQREVDQSGIDPWELACAAWRAKRLLPLRSTCLQTALVIERLFRARGLTATVRIGVSENVPTAHAWNEVGDLVLDDQRLAPHFTAFQLEPRSK